MELGRGDSIYNYTNERQEDDDLDDYAEIGPPLERRDMDQTPRQEGYLREYMDLKPRKQPKNIETVQKENEEKQKTGRLWSRCLAPIPVKNIVFVFLLLVIIILIVAWSLSGTIGVKLQCPALHLPVSSSLLSRQYGTSYAGERVIVKCNPGYWVKRDQVEQIVTCGSNGTWKTKIAPCEEVKGVWGDWSEWNKCKSKCSSGKTNRTRKCYSPESASKVQCEGDGVAYQNCIVDPTCVSLFAAFTGNLDANTGDMDLEFNKLIVDKTGAFDGNNFTVPETGLYLLSLSGGIGDKGMQLKLTTDNDEGVAGIRVQTPRTTNYDTVSRDILISLRSNTKLHVVLGSGKSTTGLGVQRLTSLTIFSYSHLMKPDGVAFMVGLTKSTSISSGAVFINIPAQFNTGDGFLEVKGHFRAPRSGLFFFSLNTIGDDSNYIYLKVDGHSTYYLRTGSYHQGYTLSRSLLLNLDIGNEVTPIGSGSIRFSGGSDNIDTSFSGFLYDPLFAEKVAFCSIGQSDTLVFSKGSNPVMFGTMVLNVGGDFRANMFICRIPGLYYFHFTHGLYESSVLTQLWLMQNETPVCGIVHDSSQYQAYGILARSVILEVKTGDWVYLKADAPEYIKIGSDLSFLGMLLQ